MAAGFTYIKYGSLELFSCLTKEFSQEAVFEESDTDLLYWKFKIRVVGYFNGRSTINTSSPPPYYYSPSVWTKPSVGPAGYTGAHYSTIRYLLQPRRTFEMWTGVRMSAGSADTSVASRILYCEPMETDSDARNPTNKDLHNGPKVRVVSLTQISGDTLIRGEFEFEICKMECDYNGNIDNKKGVLNNRWSVTDEIDGNFTTTRTFEGRLHTVGSVVNANSFRSLVVPPLQPGMRRQSMRFQVTDDGLQLQYTIVDREIHFAAPAPATSWRFTQTERAERAAGINCFVDLEVALAGDRLVDKRALIRIAASIVEHRVFLFNARRDSAIIDSIHITDTVTDDSSGIVLRATAMRTNRDGNIGAIWQASIKNIGKPVSQDDLNNARVQYDSNLSRGTRPGEKLEVQGPISLVGAFASYLQSPCSGQHGIYASDPSQSSSDGSQGTQLQIEAVIVSELEDDGSTADYSQEQQDGAFVNYQFDSIYRTEGLRAHCPIARGSNSNCGVPTSTVVTLGLGQTRRVIRGTAERIGTDPPLLNPPSEFTDENGIVHTLLDSTFAFSPPDRSCDGQEVRRLSFEHTFGLSRAVTAVSGCQDSLVLRAGVNSWQRSQIYLSSLSIRPEEEVAGT